MKYLLFLPFCVLSFIAYGQVAQNVNIFQSRLIVLNELVSAYQITSPSAYYELSDSVLHHSHAYIASKLKVEEDSIILICVRLRANFRKDSFVYVVGIIRGMYYRLKGFYENDFPYFYKAANLLLPKYSKQDLVSFLSQNLPCPHLDLMCLWEAYKKTEKYTYYDCLTCYALVHSPIIVDVTLLKKRHIKKYDKIQTAIIRERAIFNKNSLRVQSFFGSGSP